MKAFQVKQGTKVIIIDNDAIETPPSSIQVNKGDEITVQKVDGMYCRCLNKEGNLIYIAAWTKVKLL